MTKPSRGLAQQQMKRCIKQAGHLLSVMEDMAGESSGAVTAASEKKYKFWLGTKDSMLSALVELSALLLQFNQFEGDNTQPRPQKPEPLNANDLAVMKAFINQQAGNDA